MDSEKYENFREILKYYFKTSKNIKMEKYALEVLISSKLLIGKCLLISKTWPNWPKLFPNVFLTLISSSEQKKGKTQLRSTGNDQTSSNKQREISQKHKLISNK